MAVNFLFRVVGKVQIVGPRVKVPHIANDCLRLGPILMSLEILSSDLHKTAVRLHENSTSEPGVRDWQSG